MAEKHIHKLRRHKYSNGTKVYFCILDCSFKVEAAFAMGKIVLCNMCGEPFSMNEYSIKLAKPHCTGCGKMKVSDEDGKARFVPKGRPTAALAPLAANPIQSLRERLGKVVTMEKDEDLL